MYSNRENTIKLKMYSNRENTIKVNAARANCYL